MHLRVGLVNLEVNFFPFFWRGGGLRARVMGGFVEKGKWTMKGRKGKKGDIR